MSTTTKLCGLLALLFVVCRRQVAASQDDDSGRDPEDYRRTLLIVRSTSNYNSAVRAAQTAARKLRLRLDMRDRSENKELGLTESREHCMHVWNRFPCYEPRIQTMEDGEYVTVEYSTGYNDHAARIGTADPHFPEGKYLVVVASGDHDTIAAYSVRAKKHYPKAFALLAPFSGECTH